MLGDQACFGCITRTGPSVRFALGQGALGLEMFGNDLVGCFALQHALTTGIVGGIEAAPELFELTVRVDGDTQHLAANTAVEALDHAVGLWCAGAGMAILGAQLGADLGEGRGEARAVVGQHVREAEGEGGGCLSQEGDGTLLGFVVLDGEVDGAGAAINGDIQEALALLTVSCLQLGQVRDVDVDEAEVVILEGALAFDRPLS